MATWLKLDTGILDDEKIELIRQLPEGDTLFTLWVGLLCLAMKKETDALYIATDVPYNPEHLSTIFNIPIDTVRLGLEAFIRYDMLALQDDGALVIANLAEHQAMDKLDRQKKLTADRVRRYRQRKKESVTRYAVTCNSTEEEEEREEEQEKSIVRLKPHGTKVARDATFNVITLLNEKAGTSFRPDGAGSIDKVKRLLKKGYTLEQMRKVVAIKALKWKGDEKMRDYLRPSTLFGPEKFDDYLGEYDAEVRKDAERK